MNHASGELLVSLNESTRRFLSIWKKAQGKASEPSIHDLRVSGRRLSARLALVGAFLTTDDTSAARRRVRKALKRVGPLRDIHVQMDMIAEAGTSAVASEYHRHLKRLAADETLAVERYLKGARKQRLKKALADLASEFKSQAGDLSDSSIRQMIYRVAKERRDRYINARRRFEAHEEGSLHPMRIALKKVRYVVEAGQDVAGGWTEQMLRRMQAAQRLMGDSRDMEVLISEFSDWAVRHERQSEAVALLGVFERRRKALIARIMKAIQSMEVAVPKTADRPVRETTLAAPARTRTRVNASS